MTGSVVHVAGEIGKVAMRGKGTCAADTARATGRATGAVIIALAGVLAGCGKPTREAGGVLEYVHAGYYDLLRDRETGCEYFRAGWTSLTPRLDRDGRPKCGGGR